MKILLSMSLALALTSCAKLTDVYTAVSSSSVPPKAIYVAINSFDVAKASAVNYVNYCSPNPSPAGCDDAVIRTKLFPAMTRGTNARTQLRVFLHAHPGEFGPQGTYQAIVGSTDIISAIVGK